MFTDVTASSGITFVHTDGSSGRHYIMEAMSAGLAVFDYDNDGDEDLYLLNGAPLPGTVVEVPPRNALYRNNGDGTFTDVTEQAGVGDPGFGLGVTAGDYDGDGFLDLYLNNFGPNVLYRNNGNGTFTDVTETSGTANGAKVGAGCAFFDTDADGDLDLYVANYLVFSYDMHIMRTKNGYPAYPSPRDYDPVPDTLYRNNGDGTFTDVSEEAGIAPHAGSGMGIVCADFDDDGDPDVFVCNDVGANFFFVNQGNGTFREEAVFLGTAYNGNGEENASMGVDCGDYDNDGLLDFFMTSYQNELPVLYRNTGKGYFEDMTARTNAGASVFRQVNWGTALADFNNDGFRDIFISNGHTEDYVDMYDDTTSYKAANTVLMNMGHGDFTPLPPDCGSGLKPVLASRGAGVADLDNDGDLDVVILNMRDRITLLRNDSPKAGHWLQLDLQAPGGNRFGVGAKVTVFAGGLRWVDEVHSGRGYQSHWGLRLHFGLGSRDRVDCVEVRWPGGPVETFTGLSVDRRYVLRQGGEVVPVP
ncbi:CRTAC1 family protein [Thermopirellula anaerolimosa]